MTWVLLKLTNQGVCLRVKSSDVHNYLVRMREEVRLEVRSELAQTTGSREELEEEWRDFLSAS